MQTDTLVIAHRGASGYLPEHTREAKVLAYGQGADFLEQDVVATRDGRLVVLHDIFLDDVTDVASRFATRRRRDGHYYVIDFDLAEIAELQVTERRRPGSAELAHPARFHASNLVFRVVTLEDEIRLIQELNRTTGRRVGIYPEIKRPDWHRGHGFDLAGALLETLGRFGYRDAADAAFVQCFDATELRRCREELGSRLRLVQLIAGKAGSEWGAPTLEHIAEYADVVAPHFSRLIAPARGNAARLEASGLVQEAAAHGLSVHTYTLRRDAALHHGADFEHLLELLIDRARLGGLFCDHPDEAVRVRERLRHRRSR